MSQNFTNCKMYKISNDYNDDIYVGSTCDTLIKRFSYHKRGRNSVKWDNHPLFTLMREIGTERFAIYLIEDYSCNNKYELGQREGYWIRQIGTLNKRIEGRTSKEYYQDNMENRKEHQKQYYIENAEKVKEYQKQYKTENTEKVKEYQKQYGIKYYVENNYRL